MAPSVGIDPEMEQWTPEVLKALEALELERWGVECVGAGGAQGPGSGGKCDEDVDG